MQERHVWSLGWEDPLEKEMETHSSTLAWKIPWMEEILRPWGLKELDKTERLLSTLLISGQTIGRELSPTPQQKIELKIYWAWPSPVSLTVSLSHQEASISLLSYPKEDRQNENHNHRKLTNLITRITALSNSMKLWVMPCKATQEGTVMVESSEKTWSPGEGNDKPLQNSCLENSINSMKRQKIGHWKMNSPDW